MILSPRLKIDFDHPAPVKRTVVASAGHVTRTLAAGYGQGRPVHRFHLDNDWTPCGGCAHTTPEEAAEHFWAVVGAQRCEEVA